MHPRAQYCTSTLPFAKSSRKDKYCGKVLVATKVPEQPFQFKLYSTQILVPVPPLRPRHRRSTSLSAKTLRMEVYSAHTATNTQIKRPVRSEYAGRKSAVGSLSYRTGNMRRNTAKGGMWYFLPPFLPALHPLSHLLH